MNTNFYDNVMPKECCRYVCLSKVLIDSIAERGINDFQKNAKKY